MRPIFSFLTYNIFYLKSKAVWK